MGEKTKAKHPGGRPSKYNEEFHPLLAEALARNGYTDKQIAEKLEVTEQTIANWKNEHPEFFESLKRGKEEPDQVVENSLFRRATGYDNDKAVKIFMPANSKKPIYAPYTEQIQPDVTACIFWLKNRRPDRWRDKQDIDFKGTLTTRTDLSKLSDEDLERLDEILNKAD